MLRQIASIGCVSLSMGLMGSSLAPADTVEISGGGHVAGTVLRRNPSGKLPNVVVKIDDAITIAIPENRVQRVVTADQLAEYRRLALQAGDDAEKHYELAKWCAASDLPLQGQKRYHYQRAITLDPEHAYARAALDYVKEGNQWILFSEQQRTRGMIRDGGRWKLPEAVAIEDYQDLVDKTAKRWIKDVALLRSMALRDRGKPEEALKQLAAIDDPLAASAIAQELSSNQPPRAARCPSYGPPRDFRHKPIHFLGNTSTRRIRVGPKGTRRYGLSYRLFSTKGLRSTA